MLESGVPNLLQLALCSVAPPLTLLKSQDGQVLLDTSNPPQAPSTTRLHHLGTCRTAAHSSPQQRLGTTAGPRRRGHGHMYRHLSDAAPALVLLSPSTLDACHGLVGRGGHGQHGHHGERASKDGWVWISGSATPRVPDRTIQRRTQRRAALEPVLAELNAAACMCFLLRAACCVLRAPRSTLHAPRSIGQRLMAWDRAASVT